MPVTTLLPFAPEGFGRGLTSAIQAIKNADCGALFCHPFNRRFANAQCAAGYCSHFSFKSCHDSFPFQSPFYSLVISAYVREIAPPGSQSTPVPASTQSVQQW